MGADAGDQRRCDLVVVSDVHLGTESCRAAELNAYLKSVRPGALVLNGDIVDLWQVRTARWDEAQTKVVRRILKLALAGVPVWYVSGNHDEALRRYTPLGLGGIRVVDQLELDLGGRRTWFHHGDALDLLLETPRWLERLGGASYDAVTWASDRVNRLRAWFGLPRVSLAGVFKRNLASARRHVERFELACARHAAERGCDTVITGHIHVPAHRRIQVGGREIEYLNSGDWVDSCSALEYADGAWRLVRFNELVQAGAVQDPRAQLDETRAVA